MTDEPISPLRRRMIEDMKIRGFSEKTRSDSVRHVKAFAAFFGRSPHLAGPEDLRRYHLHLSASGVGSPSINSAVSALLRAMAGAKYRAALSVAYGAGLRASEVTALKIGDIDSARMTIRVEQGKGRKDRFALLSPVLLTILRAWWQEARPRGWLFPDLASMGRDPGHERAACHRARAGQGRFPPLTRRPSGHPRPALRALP